MKSKAVGYIRVSTVDQAMSGYSLSAQEALLRQYAADHDMQFVGIYADEGKSASKSLEKRTELMRLIKDAESGRFKVILFKDLTRWTRNAAAYYRVQERLDKAGVGWVAVEQPYLETLTPTGRFQVQIMLGTAQLEAEQTGQRIKFVQDAEIKRGHFPFPPHCTPTGYTTEKREDGNYLVIDERTAPIIRTVFSTFKQTYNLQRCAEAVQREHGVSYSETTINRMLRNSVYKGEFRGIKGFCQPIIETAEFDALQRPKRLYTASKHKGEYIFSGLCKCALCGSTMRANAAQDKYHMYSCKNGCHVSITQRELEQKMLDVVAPAFRDYRVIVKERKRDRAAAERKKVKLEQKAKRITELYIDGILQKSEFDRRHAEIQEQIAEIVNEPSLPEINTNFDEMYGMITNEKKAVFWRAFIDEVTIDRERHINIAFNTTKVLAERMGMFDSVKEEE